MTLHYKVWLEIEEIDESRDHYQTMDTPGGSIASQTRMCGGRGIGRHVQMTLSDGSTWARKAVSIRFG